jgi:hypothetical protein
MRTSAALAFVVLFAGACSAQSMFRPHHAFGDEAEAKRPDYRDDRAWLALPQRADDADVVPPGVQAADRQASAAADVFFIHPTTWLSSKSWSAAFDESGATDRRLTRGVLRFQASVFNECCRVFAPRYRQATLAAFLEHSPDAYAAIERAYSDVVRAFDEFARNRNQNRPFILASHSQGSLHALRLLQERIVGTPLAERLVVAYVIGGSVPAEIEQRGVVICTTANQTGCIAAWNTVETGKIDERRRARGTTWLDGHYQPMSGRPIVCVNPLDWKRDGVAAATLNAGSLPNPGADAPLRAPVPRLTGATCTDGALAVNLPADQRNGFRDPLTWGGDYHDFDYNLFYMNLRANAVARVNAFTRPR